MILCCGEALIDMIPVPVASGKEGFVPHAGGAVFNTAISLGRLGAPTAFLTGLSTDLFGEVLAEALDESNVDAGLCIRSDLPTTLAFVKLTDGHASYTFYDENTAGRSLTPDALPDIPETVDALYFGGISLISEPCADFYAALAQRESHRFTIMLDPNIRPGFIKDAAAYRARLDRLIGCSDVVKVSDEDLDWIVDGPAGLNDKALALKGRGPSLVIVTRGEEGAMAWGAGANPVVVPARRAKVVDTVGAGDTFNAGFLAYLQRQGQLAKSSISRLSDEDVANALSMGAEVASVTVSRAGANPPWAHEMSSLTAP